MQEANVAFELNTSLFTVLQPPKSGNVSHLPIPAALGDPQTPIDDTPPSPLAAKSLEDRSFPFASVLAFILALCISQVVIVFGGLSGEQGSAKIRALLQKVADILSI